MGDEDLVTRAAAFAEDAHRGQVRKWTGEPYFNHLKIVAALVGAAPTATPEAVAAAYLHDVLEDTAVTDEVVCKAFGLTVADIVLDVSTGLILPGAPRTDRVAAIRFHLQEVSPAAKTVKLADIIDNVSTVVKRAPRFARVYVREKDAVLGSLEGGDVMLWRMARRVVDKAMLQLAAYGDG